MRGKTVPAVCTAEFKQVAVIAAAGGYQGCREFVPAPPRTKGQKAQKR